MSRDITYSLNY